MEFPGRVSVQAVVAGTRPIAVIIHERVIEGEKPQRAVNVQNRRQRCRDAIGGGLAEKFAELDQGGPLRRVVLALDFVDLLIVRGSVAEIRKTGLRVRPGRLPTRTVGALEVFFQKLLIELLHVLIDAPVFPVDDHTNKVRLGRRNILPRDVKEEDRAHHRRIFVRVQEVQRPVAAHRLVFVSHIEREVQRVFAAFRNHHGRHASEANADIAVCLSIDHHICSDIDVGAVEVFEFVFPVFALKRDEYGP